MANTDERILMSEERWLNIESICRLRRYCLEACHKMLRGATDCNVYRQALITDGPTRCTPPLLQLQGCVMRCIQCIQNTVLAGKSRLCAPQTASFGEHGRRFGDAHTANPEENHRWLAIEQETATRVRVNYIALCRTPNSIAISSAFIERPFECASKHTQVCCSRCVCLPNSAPEKYE